MPEAINMMMMMIRYCSSQDVMKRDGRGDEEEVEVVG
jgi:hypothetical protein